MFKRLSNYKDQLPGSFWCLASGRFVSILGNQLSQSTLIVFFTFALDSARLVSWLQIISALVSVAILPLGGVISDKKNRVRVMIWSDFGNAFFIASIGVAIYFRELFSSHSLFVGTVFLLVGVQAVCHSIFIPAAEAIVPVILGRNSLRMGQQHLATQNQVAQVAGRAVSGLLYKALGPTPLMFFNAVCYAVSAALSSRIRVSEPAKVIRQQNTGFFSSLREGFGLVVQDREIRLLFGLSSAVVFFFAPILMVIPFYLKRELLGGEDQLGYFMAALTLGSVLGPAFQAKIGQAFKGSEKRLLLAFFLVKGTVLFSVFASTNYFWGLICIFAAGFCSAAVSVMIVVRIQRSCPHSHLGRVMSLLYTVANLFQPLSVYACGLAIDRGWMLPSELGLVLSLLVTIVPIFFIWRSHEVAL